MPNKFNVVCAPFYSSSFSIITFRFSLRRKACPYHNVPTFGEAGRGLHTTHEEREYLYSSTAGLLFAYDWLCMMMKPADEEGSIFRERPENNCKITACSVNTIYHTAVQSTYNCSHYIYEYSMLFALVLYWLDTCVCVQQVMKNRGSVCNRSQRTSLNAGVH